MSKGMLTNLFKLIDEPSEAQELKQTQLGQAVPQLYDKRRPRQAHSKKLGVIGGPGRPARPVGPTASTKTHDASLLAHNVGLGCCGWWLPAINRRG